MSKMSDDERHEVEELLPWYAAGSLSRRDMQRVKEAITRDPQLARTYQSVSEELAGTVDLNQTLGAPSDRAMEKLFANIDAEPVRRPVRARGIGERFSTFLASLSPHTLAWSATAAALLVVVQAGVIGGILVNRQTVGFQTASAPSAATGDGTFAIVQFAPDASMADVAKLLQANNVSITSGPAAGNLYRIRLGRAGLSRDDTDRIISQLQQDKTVRFIAPAE